MFKKFRYASLVAVLLAFLALNVGIPAMASVASDTPCTDQYNGCIAGGGGENFCNGMWCGCMYSTYGYVCSAS